MYVKNACASFIFNLTPDTQIHGMPVLSELLRDTTPQQYVEQEVLPLDKDAKLLVLGVVPLVLRTTIAIHLLDDTVQVSLPHSRYLVGEL